MRTGAAISVAAHVAALTACLVLAGVRPFDPTTAEAITVDIVTPEEAPPVKEPDNYDFPTLAEKDQEKAAPESSPQAAPPPQPSSAAVKPKPDTQQASLQQKPAEQPKPVEQQQQAQAQAQPQTQPQTPPPAPAETQSQPAVPTAAPDITAKFGMMFRLPDTPASDFDAKATAAANIKVEDAAALRAHLKTCSVLPRSISPADNVRVVLRVAFRQDGKLAAEPLLIEASASEKGPALMQGAMDALAKCQPYAMLPADRYDEWRMLDLSFTPKDFHGG